jgi:hypothetical protein
MQTGQRRGVLRFGIFELDLRAREWHKNGLRIQLPELFIQILAILGNWIALCTQA